eukprot:6091235-Pleurochrysis_carterae.AAC.1
MTANGGLAFQTLETLASEVALETACLLNLPLLSFSTAACPVRQIIQLVGSCLPSHASVHSSCSEESAVEFTILLLAAFACARHAHEITLESSSSLAQTFPSSSTFCCSTTSALVLIAATPVHFELFFSGDFAGVRAIKNAICGCPPEAMHSVPAAEEVATSSHAAPATVAQHFSSTPSKRISLLEGMFSLAIAAHSGVIAPQRPLSTLPLTQGCRRCGTDARRRQ